MIYFRFIKVHFEATLGLFWDGPCNLEPRSDDDELAQPLQASDHTTLHVIERVTADLQWNLEAFGLTAEALPIGHRGPSRRPADT
ncbi:hypothetical protein AVEN_74531-1 [Araneus ventricosus]|uniref:Uncharacterized protein n=1 Tax=Araneus ventricosus TaxID=182803 RepID=A0A4Y2GPP7_ARAVE|nr:hypothetical protein AVEN_74531-1 [Araneus ventricosus]